MRNLLEAAELVLVEIGEESASRTLLSALENLTTASDENAENKAKENAMREIQVGSEEDALIYARAMIAINAAIGSDQTTNLRHINASLKAMKGIEPEVVQAARSIFTRSALSATFGDALK